MATASQILTLREYVDEPTTDTYTDVRLGELIDAGSVNRAASTIWASKAAKASALVNVSEGSSSRSLSDVYSHALEMARYWGGLADNEDGGDRVMKPGRTRAIVRP